MANRTGGRRETGATRKPLQQGSIVIERKRRQYVLEYFDLFQLVPEFSERAACIGKWELFDQDENDEAAVICWSQCPVRKDCLIFTLKQERTGPRGDGEMVLAGVAGGYTVTERRFLHEAIVSEGVDLDSI